MNILNKYWFDIRHELIWHYIEISNEIWVEEYYMKKGDESRKYNSARLVAPSGAVRSQSYNVPKGFQNAIKPFKQALKK